MKFHWGHGIALFYCIFAAMLVLVVVKSREFDNSLVADDYYARDIAYQQTRDRLANSRSLATRVSFEREEGGFRLFFPERDELAGEVTGTLHFYRPSTELYDRFVRLRPGVDRTQLLPVTDLAPGHYRAIVEWSVGGTDYLDEFTLNIRP
ncbi:MAG: FixH family protein [Saprospiraceae bacterium]